MHPLFHRVLASSLLTPRAQRQLRNLLMAHADALVAGAAFERLRVPGAEVLNGQVAPLLALAEQIQRVLTPVEPPERFVAQLERDLRAAHAADRPTVWRRIRRLPPTTQIAAGIGGATITAGVVLLLPEVRAYVRRRAAA